MTKTFVLEVELVSKHSWGKSLAQLLPKVLWDRLRRLIYRRYNWTCQICSTYGVEVHCHEVWTYDDRRKIQILKDLACLCKECHNIKHWGRTIFLRHEGKIPQSYIDQLRKHFCTVNGCTEQDMIDHIVEVGDKNQMRSRYRYKIDFSRVPQIIKETEKCIEMRS